MLQLSHGLPEFSTKEFKLPAYLPKLGLAVAASILFAAPVSASTRSNPLLLVLPDARTMVAVSPGEYLRITASGNIAYMSAPPVCLRVDPRGCTDPGQMPRRPMTEALPAALIGTFVDQRDQPVARSFAPGEAADVAVPVNARQLALSINLDTSLAARGAFTVAVLPTTLRIGPVEMTRFKALTERAKAQHLLRRFGFSASPELISLIAKEGVDKWFVEQLTPSAVDDSYANSMIEPLPTTSSSTGGEIDWDLWERRLVQREIYTKRQVQEKMVLHWIDHFSVSNDKVADPAVMSEYESILRADALGNFTTLASDVARTPAMLYWLDNNVNDGSNPVINPPNENFARELMQLFTIGPYQLNIDGSEKRTSTGAPMLSFSENDVKQVARGLTGFYVDGDYAPFSNPETRFRTRFATWLHTVGPETILGKVVNVPDSYSSAYSVIASLTTYSSSAPFLAKELLQRVALENPSPRYIAEIAKVWQQNVYAKNQIALVLEAIERDPEFYTTDYHSMPKEPVELLAQFARDVPVVLKVAHFQGSTYGPGDSLLYYLNLVLQEPYDPPSVFSFYRPGDKGLLVSQVTVLDRFDDMSDIITLPYDASWANTALDLPVLRTLIGPRNTDPTTVERYLLDAMVDSSSVPLASTIKAYLGSVPVDDEHLAGTVWLIATSPEFEVN